MAFTNLKLWLKTDYQNLAETMKTGLQLKYGIYQLKTLV